MKKDTRQSFELTDKDERARLVRALMETGHSNRSAAARLGTTRGAVARTRWDYGIPSSNAPGSTPLKQAAKSQPLRLKMAASEADQCEHKTGGLRCGYEKEPGSRFCALPAHQTKAKK